MQSAVIRSFAMENDLNHTASFVTFVNGNPPPTIGWQRWDGSSWVDLVNGVPTDFDAFHFNTSPGSGNSAFLGFRAWGDQDGSLFRATLNGPLYSAQARLYVRVPTTTTIDCPSTVLASSHFKCAVTVAGIPPSSPHTLRARKPCGTVVVGSMGE